MNMCACVVVCNRDLVQMRCLVCAESVLPVGFRFRRCAIVCMFMCITFRRDCCLRALWGCLRYIMLNLFYLQVCSDDIVVSERGGNVVCV